MIEAPWKIKNITNWPVLISHMRIAIHNHAIHYSSSALFESNTLIELFHQFSDISSNIIGKCKLCTRAIRNWPGRNFCYNLRENRIPKQKFSRWIKEESKIYDEVRKTERHRRKAKSDECTYGRSEYRGRYHTRNLRRRQLKKRWDEESRDSENFVKSTQKSFNKLSTLLLSARYLTFIEIGDIWAATLKASS